jgi:hypothetical protein
VCIIKLHQLLIEGGSQMVLSVLEANVPPEKWEELKKSFRHSTEILPPQICETLLIQSAEDTQRWKVVTVWHIKQHIRRVQDTMRQCGAAEIFRAIGIEPIQGLHNIVLKAREPDLGSDMAETPFTDMLIAAEDIIEQL